MGQLQYTISIANWFRLHIEYLFSLVSFVSANSVLPPPLLQVSLVSCFTIIHIFIYASRLVYSGLLNQFEELTPPPLFILWWDLK